jgi:hypothetical protein
MYYVHGFNVPQLARRQATGAVVPKAHAHVGFRQSGIFLARRGRSAGWLLLGMLRHVAASCSLLVPFLLLRHQLLIRTPRAGSAQLTSRKLWDSDLLGFRESGYTAREEIGVGGVLKGLSTSPGVPQAPIGIFPSPFFHSRGSFSMCPGPCGFPPMVFSSLYRSTESWAW